MNASKISDILNDIEVKFNVKGWMINGIHIWPIIRINLGFHLYFSDNCNSPKNIKKSVGKNNFYFASIRNSIIAFVKDFKKSIILLTKCDILFLSFSADRISLKGKYYNKYFDSFIDSLDRKRIKYIDIELPLNNYKYNIPRQYPSLIFQPVIVFVKIQLFVLRFFNKSTDCKSFKDEYDNLSHYIKRTYDVNSVPFKQIEYTINYINCLSSVFKIFLKKIKPKIVVCMCWYSYESMALIKASNDMNISTADFQHGVQGEYHFAYGRWMNLPEQRYNTLPNFFLCWGNDEKKNIQQWNKYNSYKSIVLGNNWLIKWHDENDALVIYYDNIIKDIKANVHQKKHILFSLFKSVSPLWIVDAIKQTEEEYCWWIRLHPTAIYLKEEVEQELVKAGVTNFIDIYEASALPLYAILRHMNVHITEASTVLIEAANFNIPSIILHRDGLVHFSNELNYGIASFAEDLSNFLNQLNYYSNNPLNEHYNLVEESRIANKGIEIFKQLINNE